jgi:vancomycin permeability regulator SanA
VPWVYDIVKRAIFVATATTLLLVASVACLNFYVLLTTRGAISAGSETVAPIREYAIILGNTVSRDGTPWLELEERLETARRLYAAGRVRRLIASGRSEGDYNEPQGMATWLVAHGVSRADIVLDPWGYRTAASIANAIKLGARSVLIVSQADHLPRAIYFARQAGLDAIGVAASSEGLGRSTFEQEPMKRAEAVLEAAIRGVRS